MMESVIEEAAVFWLHQSIWFCAPQSVDWNTASHWPGCLLVQWITDYLTNRMQYVVVNGVSSKPLSAIFRCAPGICPGAPSFFFIYINGIAELPLSPESKLVMYADACLLGKHLTINPCSRMLKYLEMGYLTFNPSKSKAMVFSSDMFFQPLPTFHYIGLHWYCWQC